MAAIASTAFVLFITPHSDNAEPRHVLGGRLSALVIGSLMALVVDSSVIGDWLADYDAAFVVYAAVGVGLTMFVMAATDTEHPPAAGTALGVVAHRFDWGRVLFVTVAVLILAAVHRALRSKMLDLR